MFCISRSRQNGLASALASRDSTLGVLIFTIQRQTILYTQYKHPLPDLRLGEGPVKGENLGGPMGFLRPLQFHSKLEEHAYYAAARSKIRNNMIIASPPEIVHYADNLFLILGMMREHWRYLCAVKMKNIQTKLKKYSVLLLLMQLIFLCFLSTKRCMS